MDSNNSLVPVYVWHMAVVIAPSISLLLPPLDGVVVVLHIHRLFIGKSKDNEMA